MQRACAEPIGGAGSEVELGDGVSQKKPAHLLVRRVSGLLLPIRGPAHPDYPTGIPFRIAQVRQLSDDRAEPFGRTTSWPLNRALAAFTNSSSSLRSLIRRLARASSSGS